MRSAALIACLVLAGCVQVPEDTPADRVAAPLDLAWTLTDCNAIVALVPVSAAAVQPHLPPGFTPASFAESGLPPDPRGEAVVGVEGWTCKSGLGLHGAVENIDYASLFAIVHPPANLSAKGSKFQFVKWQVGVPDADRRAALAGAGASAVDAKLEMARFDTTPAGIDLMASLAFNGTYELQAAASAPATATDPEMARFTFTEFQPAANGTFVTWTGTLENPHGFDGGGTLALPPGILADIAGASNVQAYYLVATSASLVSGTIRGSTP